MARVPDPARVASSHYPLGDDLAPGSLIPPSAAVQERIRCKGARKIRLRAQIDRPGKLRVRYLRAPGSLDNVDESVDDLAHLGAYTSGNPAAVNLAGGEEGILEIEGPVPESFLEVEVENNGAEPATISHVEVAIER